MLSSPQTHSIPSIKILATLRHLDSAMLMGQIPAGIILAARMIPSRERAGQAADGSRDPLTVRPGKCVTADQLRLGEIR